MGLTLQRLGLFVGMLLYLFDYGSDIYVAVQHWKNDEYWWFGLTVGFISVPSLIVNCTAVIQIMNTGMCIAAILQLSIFVRYIEALVEPDKRTGTFSRTHLLAMLRYLETITESAPQWCLQVYIMLRQWSFPTYTVVSSAFSLLSLAWSITALERERRKRNNEIFTFIMAWGITALERERRKRNNQKLTFINGLLFWIWQMSTLISRLSAIVLFAYVFRYYVIIPLAVHWLILVVTIFLIEISNGGKSRKSLLLSLMAGCSSLVHSAESDLSVKRPKPKMIVGYVFLILVSAIMLTLSLTIDMADVAHMDILMPTGIALVAGGSFLSVVFCMYYYLCD